MLPVGSKVQKYKTMHPYINYDGQNIQVHLHPIFDVLCVEDDQKHMSFEKIFPSTI